MQQRRDARLVHEHVDEVPRPRLGGQDLLHHQIALEPLDPGHHGPVHLRHPAYAHAIQQHIAAESLRHLPRW
jgi:hypothetical protein